LHSENIKYGGVRGGVKQQNNYCCKGKNTEKDKKFSLFIIFLLGLLKKLLYLHAGKINASQREM
jgi:hypothetical protein